MSKHLILAIDDVEEEVMPNIPGEPFYVRVIDPNDADLPKKLSGVIASATLILLDQKFNAGPTPLSLMASDGASFVSHLRSWARMDGKSLAPIVLFTNEDEAFKNEITAIGAAIPLNGTFVDREFQLAPALDVEWIQHKGENDAKSRIEDLAYASLDAQEVAGTNGISLEQIECLLEVPSESAWTDRAREELRGARPPVSHKDEEGAKRLCGPAQFIRWMCHRALPFPGMFFSDLYAAWALGLSIDAFRSIIELNPTTPWLQDLAASEYGGPLYEFLGRRWWRAGIDHLVWTLDQESSKQQDRQNAFRVLVPHVEVGEIRSSSTHVVTWTPTFVESEIISIDDAVQLHPPGWPAEALDPWLSRADTEGDKVLQAMVEVADLR
jgi:hypothetical protein